MQAVYKAEPPKYSTEVKKLLSDLQSGGILGSFFAHPKKFKFESQQDDEEILILGRRHFITNLGWIALISFAFVIPFFWTEFPFIQSLDGNTQVTLTMLYYMVLLFFSLQNFLMWFYNVYIVTNERLVDIDFVGLLSKTVNVAQISNVEDVNYTQRGIMASFFNYGDVIAQTASEQKTPDSSGEASAFTFEAVGMPDKVAAMISQLVEDADKGIHKH